MFGRKKKIDTSKLFQECMQEGTEFVHSATDITTYLRSPFQLYCKHFGDHLDKDQGDEQLGVELARMGNEFEDNINEAQFPEVTPEKPVTFRDGFMHVLDDMVKGKKMILKGILFYLPDGMLGVIDRLEKVKGKSIFGSYYYVIKEIKSMNNIKKQHIIQGAFYNYVIGKIQGYVPDTFYIINMGGIETPYRFADHEEELFQTIQDVIEIRKGVIPSPTYDSGWYPWQDYCNRMALESKDLSLISGIAKVKKEKLLEYNIKNLDDLLVLGISGLQKIPLFAKKTSMDYIMSAKALTTNKIIRKSKNIILPQTDTEIFLDLDGLNNHVSNYLGIKEMNYLIGALVCKGDSEEYYSFVAHDNNKEEEMLNEFIDFMKKQKDYTIYHWGAYDRTCFTRMMNRYGISQENKDELLSKQRFFGLHKIITEQFAFPFPGTGLKIMAKERGFEWTHPEVDAMSSTSLYLDYVTKSDREVLRSVLDYNQEDCRATKKMKDWLIEQGKPNGVGIDQFFN